MTYPPQQPGPYGQQNPWGQPPPGQFPPQQQPPSQAPPWAAGGGGYPGFDQQPQKSKGPKIALVVILVLLVLGGGGFGAWMLLNKDDDTNNTGGGGDGGDGARAAAETYVEELQTAINTKLEDIDLSALEPVTCADEFKLMEKQIGAAQQDGDPADGDAGTVEIGLKDFTSSGEKASFLLTQTVEGKKAPDHEMSVAKEDGDWKVCGLYEFDSSGQEDPSEDVPTDAPTEEPTDEPPASDGQVPNPIPTT
jgi:hypothetical protein